MVNIIRELDTVCETCLYVVAYGTESEDQEKAFASWPEWATDWTAEGSGPLAVACGGEEGDCDHGFTWSPCDLCGQAGIEPHRVVQFDR